MQEAISGPFFLVRGGQIVVSAEDTALMPRNSIGLKADGTVVTFVADGRQDPYSVGQTLYELAEFPPAQGVTDALYLDGGGSATYATQRERARMRSLSATAPPTGRSARSPVH